MRVLGDVIAKPTPYERIPLDAPTRTGIFLGSQVTSFSRDPSCHIETPTWNLYQEVYKQKWYWKGLYLLYYLRSPTKSTFKCLFKHTPLWHVVMSKNPRNPEDEDDREKGMLSNQPQLMCITPTALLGSWVLQPQSKMWHPLGLTSRCMSNDKSPLRN